MEVREQAISFQKFFGVAEGSKSMHPHQCKATIKERYTAMGLTHDEEKLHHGCGHVSQFSTWPLCELCVDGEVRTSDEPSA